MSSVPSLEPQNTQTRRSDTARDSIGLCVTRKLGNSHAQPGHATSVRSRHRRRYIRIGGFLSHAGGTLMRIAARLTFTGIALCVVSLFATSAFAQDQRVGFFGQSAAGAFYPCPEGKFLVGITARKTDRII